MDSLVHERVHSNLATLKLDTVESILDSYLESALSEGKSAIEILDYLMVQEINARKASIIEYRLMLSGISARKNLDDFDFTFQPSIDQNVIRDLRSLRFIHNCENVVLLGPAGVGKTHIAIGLTVDAINGGFSAYFTTANAMIEKLKMASNRDRLDRCLAGYARYNLLVVDEIGYLPLDRKAANLFFQVVSQRYEKNPTVFTSNKAFGDWGEILSDSVLASAVLDRILHHGTVVNIKGESYRLKKRRMSPQQSSAGGQGKV